MFGIGTGEVMLLIVIAIIVFGPERLPEFARKAAQLVNYVRGVATQAQQQLADELGPEFKNMDFRDLNPKQFIRKHLLDEVEPIVADVKAELTSGTDAFRDATAGWRDDFDLKSQSPDGPEGASGEEAAVVSRHAPFDPDAT